MMAQNGLLLADLNDTLATASGPCGELLVKGSTLTFMPGVVESVRLLVRTCGWRLAIVTNQPGAKRDAGTSEDDIFKLLDAFVETLIFEADLAKDGSLSLHACLHDNEDNCGCRKPKIGLLYCGWSTHESYLLPYAPVWMVGDRWSDIKAGLAFGCRTCKVGPFGWGSDKGNTAWREESSDPDLWVPTFSQAVSIITSEVLPRCPKVV